MSKMEMYKLSILTAALAIALYYVEHSTYYILIEGVPADLREKSLISAYVTLIGLSTGSMLAVFRNMVDKSGVATNIALTTSVTFFVFACVAYYTTDVVWYLIILMASAILYVYAYWVVTAWYLAMSWIDRLCSRLQ